ncbi:MAG: hypothetical protein ACRCXA_08420 [Peptostreptococcaceae bacterium]
MLGYSQGVINASILGQASRYISANTDNWNDIGSEDELFNYIKQLWHTLAYFG